MKRGIMHLLPFNLESASSSIADSEMNRGDLTPLVYGFLKILSRTIEDTIGVLKRKKDQLQRYEKKIDALGFNDKLMEEIYYILLQAAFFYGRGITITELADMVGKARNTIQKRLDSMPGNHLIVEKKGKTNFYNSTFPPEKAGSHSIKSRNFFD